MTTDLITFGKSFNDEAALCRALIGLFSKIGKIRNIRYAHGPAELGKDIIFDTVDVFGDTRVVACVVKNEKITGNADTGARMVVNQALQALDSEFIDDRGKKCYIDEVYIISPYEIGQMTVTSVKGAMGRGRGQVTFMCGYRLLSLFKEYWPDYLVLEANLIRSYTTQLALQVGESAAVANVLFQHGLIQAAHKQLSHIYVHPSLEINVRQFGFKVSSPKLEFLERAVTEAQMDELVAGLSDLSQLSLMFRSFGCDECATGEEDTQATALPQRLRAEWDRLYSELRAKDVKDQRRATSRGEAAITLDKWPELRTGYELSLHRESRRCQFIQKVVERANYIASRPDLGPTLLRSKEYSEYCLAEMFWRAVPRLVPSTSDPVTISLPSDLVLEADFPVLITAPAGCGKSSFCRWSALRDAEYLLAGKHNIVPIYVPLHTLSAKEITTFSDTFFVDPTLKSILKEAKSTASFRLYLDGLDEVPSIDKQREIVRAAQKGWEESQGRIGVVFAGREHLSGQWLLWLVRIRLSEFGDVQIKELAQKLLEESDLINRFWVELAGTTGLRSILGAPLMCTLTLYVYRAMRRLPENKIRLYDMFVSLLCGGWDLAKGINRGSEFGQQPKLELARILAAFLHQCRKLEIDSTDMKLAMRQVLPHLESQGSAVLSEFVQDGLLVPVGDKHAFAHLSFQDYFAARDLMEPTGRRAELALSEYLAGDDWRKEVLAFYMGMLSRPNEAASWIKDKASEIARKVGSAIVEPRAEYLISVLPKRSGEEA